MKTYKVIYEFGTRILKSKNLIEKVKTPCEDLK